MRSTGIYEGIAQAHKGVVAGRHVRFRVLGPLEASQDDGTPLRVAGSRPYVVLAVLLMNANHWVSADRLALSLWGDEPPRSHVSNLHTYLSRLRQALPEFQIESAHGSYRLTVDASDLDLLAFKATVRTAREHVELGDHAEAARAYRAALDLWRGRPLENLTIPLLEPQISGLEQEHLFVTEEWLDVELTSGRGAALIGELTTLTSLHPLRERLREQLMRALAQAGRRADALEVYTSFRATLIEELAVEPGPELQRAHFEILRGEVAPTRPVRQRVEEAVLLAERALAVFREFGDPVGEVSARRAKGLAWAESGREAQACSVLELACATARELEEPFLVALILNIYMSMCRYRSTPANT